MHVWLVIETFLQPATYWSSERGMIALFEHTLEGFGMRKQTRWAVVVMQAKIEVEDNYRF